MNELYLNAGVPINISFEDNGTFGIQQKTLVGTRLDYRINKDFNLGATYMHLSERPFTPKVNYGDDPISNTMAGADVRYFTESPGLTRFLDKLPGYSTKEPSSITFNAEGAAFIPGHAPAIGDDGNIYIDDFESSKSNYDLKLPNTAWSLSSTPASFPEYILSNNLATVSTAPNWLGTT